jgi:1,4-dihydroxy-2-naphthoyl-CoA hydrolase
MSIWHHTPSLEELNAVIDGTIMRPLGIAFTEVGADFIRAAMPVDERTRQPYGLLHGGASVVLAETVGSTGASLCIDPARFLCVGQEINANHLRSVRSGRVIGTARPVHVGSRSQVWGIEIVNEAGALVCISRLTMAILERTKVTGNCRSE